MSQGHFLSRLPQWCSVVSDDIAPSPADYFQLICQGGAARTVAEREGGETVYSTSSA